MMGRVRSKCNHVDVTLQLFALSPAPATSGQMTYGDLISFSPEPLVYKWGFIFALMRKRALTLVVPQPPSPEQDWWGATRLSTGELGYIPTNFIRAIKEVKRQQDPAAPACAHRSDGPKQCKPNKCTPGFQENVAKNVEGGGQKTTCADLKPVCKQNVANLKPVCKQNVANLKPMCKQNAANLKPVCK